MMSWILGKLFQAPTPRPRVTRNLPLTHVRETGGRPGVGDRESGKQNTGERESEERQGEDQGETQECKG